MSRPAHSRSRVFMMFCGVAVSLGAAAHAAQTAASQNPPAAQQAPRQPPDPVMDQDRARRLYVSNEPEDHAPGYDFKRDIAANARPTPATPRPAAASWTSRRSPIAAASATWTSPPICSSRCRSAAPGGHAAMVWVHGGVHGNWGITMFPFVKEAVERGYVVICPEYRGSTGYGEAHHNAIDYGG